jgi:hypothetical protein
MNMHQKINQLIPTRLYAGFHDYSRFCQIHKLTFVILQRMSQRLYGSETLASNARLRQHLMSNGGIMTTSDFVSVRMAELRGIKSPLTSPKARLVFRALLMYVR